MDDGETRNRRATERAQVGHSSPKVARACALLDYAHKDMATSEENENNLHYCRIKRDNCAGQTGDSELSSDEHVKNRGYALSYIIAIQHEIYRLRPELTSDYHRDKSVDGDVSKVTENREATFAWK